VSKDCPVIKEAEKVLLISGDLRKAMKRLRSKLNQCTDCEDYQNCPEIVALQDQINTAIAELTEEWNLVP
jgi:hypothetical protein